MMIDVLHRPRCTSRGLARGLARLRARREAADVPAGFSAVTVLETVDGGCFPPAWTTSVGLRVNPTGKSSSSPLSFARGTFTKRLPCASRTAAWPHNAAGIALTIGSCVNGAGRSSFARTTRIASPLSSCFGVRPTADGQSFTVVIFGGQRNRRGHHERTPHRIDDPSLRGIRPARRRGDGPYQAVRDGDAAQVLGQEGAAERSPIERFRKRSLIAECHVD